MKLHIKKEGLQFFNAPLSPEHKATLPTPAADWQMCLMRDALTVLEL